MEKISIYYYIINFAKFPDFCKKSLIFAKIADCLQNFANFFKIQPDSFVDLEKPENEYLVAIVAVDPAENEPSKVSLIPAQYPRGAPRSPAPRPCRCAPRPRHGSAPPRYRASRQPRCVLQEYQQQKSAKIDVTTPIFASKYSFFQIFRDLHVLHTFAPLRSKSFRKCCYILKDFQRNFRKMFKMFFSRLQDLIFE